MIFILKIQYLSIIKIFLKDYNLIKVDVSDFKNGEMVLNVAKNDKYFFS